MLFHFHLMPVAEIEPWGGTSPGGEKTLHWFGLTDGCYWLDVGGVELFRYSEPLVAFWEQQYPEESRFQGAAACRHYVDYQIVRLWEDILDILPAVLEPVPEDLAARLRPGGIWDSWAAWKRWRERAYASLEDAEEDAYDLFFQATGWRGERQLDTGYLTAGPGIWFWREDERIHLRWDNQGLLMDGIPAWSAQTGEAQFSAAEFVDQVRSFDARLMQAMAERVDETRHAWPHPDVRLDWNGLRREHRKRAGWLANALARPPLGTDWQAVRAALAEFERRNRPEPDPS